MQNKHITIISDRKEIVLNTEMIIYLMKVDKSIQIHLSDGKVYKTRMALTELEDLLGDEFIKIHRGCVVSAMAIHDITDSIQLVNGESLIYTIRKKKEIIDRFRTIQRNIVGSFSRDGIPVTAADYMEYYRSFDSMPFAFADIEMVFDDDKHAVDWIFRYGNKALAELERLPLSRLIGSSFGSIFSNMDSKWLRCYERAVLFGDTLEIIDYSPEVDRDLKVICFPTFKGHCGCILFDTSGIEFMKSSTGAYKALISYLSRSTEDR